MKILYVAMDAAPYADRSHEVKVAETIAEAGHEVHLLVEREPRWSEASPKPANLTFAVEPVNQADKAAEVAWRAGSDFDVAFASSVSGAPILAHWGRGTGRPTVAQVLDCPRWRLDFGDRGPWLRSWEPWFRALTKMSALVVNTNQTAQDLKAAAGLYGVDPAALPPTETVYYGIDTEAADAAEPIERSREQMLCGAVSRLVPYKGFDLAMHALSLIPEAKRPGYAVVGAGEDLERLAHVAALTNVSTMFTGGIDDAAKFSLIKSLDFGLYLAFNRHIPSQFPMEAVYCGVPCIVADIPINHERFGAHGVLYEDPHNTLDVSSAVEHLAEDVAQHGTSAWDMARHIDWIRKERSFASHARGVLEVLRKVAA